MEKFFVTLSSDSLCEFNEHNTPSKFRVHLGRVIELIGHYEVALCEVFFPATLFNVRTSDCFITRNIVAQLKKTEKIIKYCDLEIKTKYVCLQVIERENEVEHHHRSSHSLENKYYHSTDDFLYDLNEQLQSFFSFKVDEESNKIILTCHAMATENEKVTFTLSDTLESILGFPKNSVFEPGFLYRSETSCDLRKGVSPMLSVCSDLVADQIINNGHEKLLRTFHISPEKYIQGFQRKESFSRLHFIPVVKKKIEFADIYIKDETGKEASFTHGTLKVVLLFRRVRNE